MEVNVDKFARIASSKDRVIREIKERVSKMLIDEPDNEKIIQSDNELDLDEIPEEFSERLGEILDDDPFFVDKLKSLFGVFNESESRHLLEKMNMGQCLYMIDKMQKASKGKMIDKKKR
tara:strand:+ start:187 stop:543 length:357 start_codon:yes stop_codon:yes gene_type:complete